MKFLNIFHSTKKDYKKIAEKNKARVINDDVNKMKKECIREFKMCVQNGISECCVDFSMRINSEFLDEVSERVLKELREEHENIEFSFCWRHFQNSYKGIKMVAR